MGRMFKHLTETDRYRIERYLKEGLTVREIADKLRVHRSTIYNELKRGACLQMNSDLTTEMRYCADVAESRYREHLKDKGPELKIGNNKEYADYLEELMRDEDYSPAAALAKAEQSGRFTMKLSKGTVYSYVSKGVFLDLTNKDLPRKGEHKQSYRKVRPARAPKGESIEQRPEEINERQELGHWEMDTVVSAKRGKKSLLVMTERVSRYELIFLLKEHTMDNVVRTLDGLEKQIGKKRFQDTFKSITVDNGSEFQDYEGMKRSIRSGDRTEIYYCHPYSSYERGSNENQNGMIRRKFPKDTNFDEITKKAVKAAQEWLNNYPRQLLGWKCANVVFSAFTSCLSLV